MINSLSPYRKILVELGFAASNNMGRLLSDTQINAIVGLQFTKEDERPMQLDLRIEESAGPEQPDEVKLHRFQCENNQWSCLS